MTRVQADVVPATVDYLDVQNLGAEVRTNVPETWTTENGPLLIVADDGGSAIWPVKSRHTIRLTAWAIGRTQARAIVALAAGKLGDGRPDGVANVERDMGGILDARDPATGAMLASALVYMHARTVDV